MSHNQASGHKKPSACEHKAFVVHHDVQTMSRSVNGRIVAYDFVGHVFCFDCGMEFEPFRVRLHPKFSTIQRVPGNLVESHTTKQ